MAGSSDSGAEVETGTAGATADSRLIEVRDDILSSDLQEQAVRVCSGKSWYFGQVSTPGDAAFWKMDLGGNVAFDAIWQCCRGWCEKSAGMPLKVSRQYANGQTYGLDGAAHRDDNRPGCYTLLYYPVTQWDRAWGGETFFYNATGEIVKAILPAPNRAVLFDSRILHRGAGPARGCVQLRVSVAFKLEALFWSEFASRART